MAPEPFVIALSPPRGSLVILRFRESLAILRNQFESTKLELMSRTTFLRRKFREVSFITRALASSRHPVLARIIPMRRCNLACGYCNEYDHTSSPVPLALMKGRLDKLAELGTSIV